MSNYVLNHTGAEIDSILDSVSNLGNAKIYYGTCSTAADIAQKDVVCSAYTHTGDPVKGDIIFVTFDNTNAAAVADLTLKVGNSTAKNIKYQGTTTIVNIPAVGYLIEDMTYRFQYNGEFWVVMLNYDSNTNTLQRIYASSANVEFPLAGQANGTTTTAPLAITSSNKACYGTVPNTAANKATINAYTGKITIPSGLVLGTSNSKLGNIIFKNAANNYTITLNAGVPVVSRTITLPIDNGTLALLESPSFTGTPKAPTATAGTNTTQIATTAFVQAALSGISGGGTPTDLSSYAPLDSPALTGTPTAPTAEAGTNSTQIATTAFVQNIKSSLAKIATSGNSKDIQIPYITSSNNTTVDDLNFANLGLTYDSIFWFGDMNDDLNADLYVARHFHSNKAKKILTDTDVATVATSGSYNDLTNKPTIPAAQVQTDWNASSGMGAILNKPTIPTIPTNISAFTNNVGYITSPFSETGTITTNNAGWYNAGTTITGTYALMGDMCILRAYADTKSGWGEVHYTLPVAAAQGASTVAYEGGHQYMISTGEQNNISVCTIRKIGGGNQQGNDTIHFTLIYRYQ